MKLLYAYDSTLITSDGKSSLGIPCSYGHAEMVEWFYELHSELTNRSLEEKKRDFEMACYAYHFKVMDVLLKMTPEVISHIAENPKVASCLRATMQTLKLLNHCQFLIQY